MNTAKHAAIVADLALLAERFPKTFIPAAPGPLKRGIHLDLRAAMPDWPHRRIRKVLSYYVTNSNYRQAHVAGAARVDLAGAAVDIVTLEDVQHAAARRARVQQAAWAQYRAAKAANSNRVFRYGVSGIPLSEAAAASLSRSAHRRV